MMVATVTPDETGNRPTFGAKVFLFLLRVARVTITLPAILRFSSVEGGRVDARQAPPFPTVFGACGRRAREPRGSPTSRNLYSAQPRTSVSGILAAQRARGPRRAR